MAGSLQYTVASSAVPIASAPAASAPGPVGWFYIANGAAAIFIGGPGVTTGTGAQIAANGTLSGFLFPGDQLYAICGTSSTVGVLTAGT